jgi:hypothetical protein
VRTIWYELLASAAAAGEGGRLRFPVSVSEALSRLLAIAEPDVETALASLALAGFLDVDGDGRTLWMPGAREGQARSAAARVNGVNGGRPKKGETPEQARARRAQQSLMLPLPGGHEAQRETQGTETEPTGESSCARVSATAESAKASAASWPEIQALGEELADIAGIDGARHPFTFKPVQDWLAQGAEPDLQRQVIRRVVERPSYDRSTVKGLGYFGPAMREALERGERVAPHTSGNAAGPAAAPRADLAAYAAWARGGMHGPMPAIMQGAA